LTFFVAVSVAVIAFLIGMFVKIIERVKFSIVEVRIFGIFPLSQVQFRAIFYVMKILQLVS
jgi:hypothetical protein